MKKAEDIVVEMVLGASDFEAPRGEESCFKGIPMEFYDHPMMRRFIRNQGLRARFRGPRRKDRMGKTSYQGKLTCLKADATHFSLYSR